MELIVAHFVDPVTTMVIIESQNRPICFSQIPDPYSAIGATCCHCVQPALIVGQVEHLVDMGREA